MEKRQSETKNITRAPAGSRVAVLGASTKPEKFSFMAVHNLKENGYQPIPVHPAGHFVDGIPGVKSLDKIKNDVDTLTVYVNSKISSEQKDEILQLNPRRVIFNPGAENKELSEILKKAGIEIVEDCTLVMLRKGSY